MNETAIPSGPDHKRLLKLASYASVCVAATFIVAKAVAWIITDSVAVLSTLLDSFFDLFASFTTFVAIRHALSAEKLGCDIISLDGFECGGHPGYATWLLVSEPGFSGFWGQIPYLFLLY